MSSKMLPILCLCLGSLYLRLSTVSTSAVLSSISISSSSLGNTPGGSAGENMFTSSITTELENYSNRIYSYCLFESLLPARQAVVVIRGPNPTADRILGSVIFTQSRCDDVVRITGSISGLTPGLHGWHVHEIGDLRNGCNYTQEHFNPGGSEPHGGPEALFRHNGDLGNIFVNPAGVATISVTDRRMNLYGLNSIIGRALVVHELTDDFLTQPTGNSGEKIGCGVIGRLL